MIFAPDATGDGAARAFLFFLVSNSMILLNGIVLGHGRLRRFSPVAPDDSSDDGCDERSSASSRLRVARSDSGCFAAIPDLTKESVTLGAADTTCRSRALPTAEFS